MRENECLLNVYTYVAQGSFNNIPPCREKVEAFHIGSIESSFLISNIFRGAKNFK